ncbi:MAG: hypothetical protein EA428_01585 [Spirochaetaceae bacterium]|nr:MAG: hypothetical protein EA428_01585 [Spirochaetaceae bacterium]
MSKHAAYALGLLLVLFAFVATVPGEAQSSRPIVGVASFETAADPRVEAAANSISSTIELTLRLLDRYEVRRAGSFSYTGGPPPTQAGLRELDFIVFGSVEDSAGRIVLDLSVYSRAENAVTSRHEDAVDSVFDLFDAADEAAISLLESFSGELIRFASLRLQNAGSPGTYTVYVDDVPLGEDLSEARVLVGSRSVRIQQERMLEEHVVYEGVHNFQDGGTTTVEFRIPLATAQERRTLVGLEQDILDAWDDPDRVPVVEQLFSRAFFLLEDIEYSRGLAAYRDSFLELKERYDERVASGFEEEETPSPAIAAEDEEPEAEPAPAAPGFTRPEPPTVRGAVGLKGGLGVGWFTGSDWLDRFDEHGPDWTGQFSVFGYYQLHPNLAIQAQLGRQRHTTNSLDNDFDLLFHFWTTDFALLLRPTARGNIPMVYLLVGPSFSLTTSEVTVSEYDFRDELDTFDLESDPFLGLVLGGGLGLRIGRAELFGELIYTRTGFETFAGDTVSNSVNAVIGIAGQLH